MLSQNVHAEIEEAAEKLQPVTVAGARDARVW